MLFCLGALTAGPRYRCTTQRAAYARQRRNKPAPRSHWPVFPGGPSEKGWEVHYLCPNVYLLDDRYVGKIVFIGKQPEKVYDIGWRFNPDVSLEPAKNT